MENYEMLCMNCRTIGLRFALGVACLAIGVNMSASESAAPVIVGPPVSFLHAIAVAQQSVASPTAEPPSAAQTPIEGPPVARDRRGVLRCGTRFEPDQFVDEGGLAGGAAGDCSATFTNPAPEYAPTSIRYRIPVVVHVMRNTAGTLGHLTLAQIQAQINVLNEDFLAIPGTPGGLGFNCEIEFYLTPDFGTTPGTGVLYYNNDGWYDEYQNDTYYNTIAKDPHNYLNMYTCLPHALNGQEVAGYTLPPFGGVVGTNADRIVLNWNVVGDPCPGGFSGPYGEVCMGRTATHEVGHYLGLHHTFTGGCGIVFPPNCYSSGDFVCDTNATSDLSGNTSCQTTLNTCGDGADNVRNYMDYSVDACQTNFTPEQAHRMRCMLEHWRVQLPEIIPFGCPAAPATFDLDFTNTPNLLYSDVAVSGTTIYDPTSCQAGLTDGAGETPNTYAGSPNQHVGNEVAYRIQHAGGHLKVTLTGLAANLDLFLLGSDGTPEGTLAYSESAGRADEIVLFAGATAGTYYAVVDTVDESNGGSDYSIKYEAPPAGLNIDINASAGAGAGAPAGMFDGAALQSGSWTVLTGASASTNLAALNGYVTAMTLTRAGGINPAAFNNANTSGNHELLLDDTFNGPSIFFTFAHLPKGRYKVYTYAITPYNATFRTDVSVIGSTSPNPQPIGGTMPVNGFAPSITHAVHSIDLAPGGYIVVSVATSVGSSNINGFQIVPQLPCADFDGSNTVDVDDLLAVILLWGSCDSPCPPNCMADFVPNCAVDVDDLVAVILGWGACP
jgi:hypothetical protein